MSFLLLIIISLEFITTAKNLQAVLITNDNIEDFNPALILQTDESHYIVPIVVDSYQDIGRPYSTRVFLNGVYLCPVTDENAQTSSQNIDNSDGFNARDYCLVEKNFPAFGPYVCDNEVKPFIVESPEEVYYSRAECTGGSKYYSFVYRKDCGSRKFKDQLVHNVKKLLKKNYNDVIPYASQPVDFTTYYICYNHDNMETTFIKYYMQSPRLFRNTGTKRERELNFEMKTDGYGLFGDQFEKIKNAYDEGNEYGMVGTLLVSPDDMELGLLRKPTFHYVNMKPMQEKLVKIWDTFNKRLRTLIIQHNMTFTTIHIGTFGALQANGHQLYLDEDGDVLIPEIWCKVAIRKSSYGAVFDGIVFVMHNFYYQNQPISKKYCSEDKCNLINWDEIENDELMTALVQKYVYCCELSEEIADLFHMDYSDVISDFGIFNFLVGSSFNFSIPELYEF